MERNRHVENESENVVYAGQKKLQHNSPCYTHYTTCITVVKTPQQSEINNTTITFRLHAPTSQQFIVLETVYMVGGLVFTTFTTLQ